MTSAAPATARKRVSWVELYFDLIFVFAVSQVAHEIAADPRWRGILASFGVFITLWWTWIGFVVLYNRQGDDKKGSHRIVVLLGTIPCAVAATQLHLVFERDVLRYGLALGAARLLLAGAYLFAPPSAGDAEADKRARGRLVPGYGFCGLLFAGSAALAHPWRYYAWALAIAIEGSLLLLGERRVARERYRGVRPEHRPSRTELLKMQLAPPAHPSAAVDSGHLAERFGLFVIILLGEIVITVGAAAIDRGSPDLGYWLSLLGGLVLGGALWWVYFDAAAELNEKLLSASGGNPTMAYSLYAIGHLIPAFSLLTIAAGVSLSLHKEPPGAAPWLVTGGLTAYLIGTRSFTAAREGVLLHLGRFAALVLTAALAVLGRWLSAPVVVAIAAGWAVLAAAAVTLLRRRAIERLGDDPLAFLTGAGPT